MRGGRSSREIQRACLEDMVFRVLAAGQSPDFRTLAGFRLRHLGALEELFDQVVHLGSHPEGSESQRPYASHPCGSLTA